MQHRTEIECRVQGAIGLKGYISPLNANPTKWSNPLKQFAASSTNYLRVFDHFMGFALKGLIKVEDQ